MNSENQPVGQINFRQASAVGLNLASRALGQQMLWNKRLTFPIRDQTDGASFELALARRIEENRTALVISEAQLGAARICGKRQNANDSSCQGDEWEMLHKQHCAVVHDAIGARKRCLDARLGRKVTDHVCEFRI